MEAQDVFYVILLSLYLLTCYSRIHAGARWEKPNGEKLAAEQFFRSIIETKSQPSDSK
jgi:hypothetical protein